MSNEETEWELLKMRLKENAHQVDEEFTGDDYTDGEILDILFDESGTESVQDLIQFIRDAINVNTNGGYNAF